MGLSNRLSRIHSFHDGAEVIWDIGCDHGLLGLSFLSLTHIREIHLVDPSGPVIGELKRNLKDSYISIPNQISIHHQKGQDVTLSPERKTIFIAGMGGKEILEIAAAMEEKVSVEDRLVVSPHRKVLELRTWLQQSSYRLISEEVILEDGQFYPVLCLSKNLRFPTVSSYGVDMWKTPEGRLYREHQLAFFGRHMDRASKDYVSYLKSINPTN